MNIFKKLTVLLFISVSALMADYTVFVTKSIPFSGGSEKEVFFGTWEEYGKSQSELLESMAKHGTMGAINGVSNGAKALAEGFIGEGMKSAGAGLAIGLVIGALNPYVMSLYADQEYVLIKNVKLPNGVVARKAIIFVGDKHPSLSEAEIHKVLRSK
jgi:hypothetical protein